MIKYNYDDKLIIIMGNIHNFILEYVYAAIY